MTSVAPADPIQMRRNQALNRLEAVHAQLNTIFMNQGVIDDALIVGPAMASRLSELHESVRQMRRTLTLARQSKRMAMDRA